MACWLVIGPALGWIALQLLGDRVGRFVTPLQALTPWTVPFVFVAAVVAVVLGRHVAAGTGAVTGAVFLALVAPLAFPAGLPEPAGVDTLTITHANLLYSNPRIDAAIEVILATDADVLAFSELTPEFAAAIDASAIGDRYHYRIVRPGAAAVGLGIWSRVPIDTGEPIDGSTMTLAVEVGVGGTPMQIVLAHPLPPLFQADHWRAEMRAMASLDDATLARTVMVADLNVSYFHPPFRRFLDRTDLRDVHQALGDGFSVSWPTDEVVPPFVRLDHALVGERVTATAIDDHDVPGGDHRAFTVTVSWAAG